MGRKKLVPGESDKYAKILKTASKMFMSHSYSAISMDALAEAVPVSKRTLYNHFKDKKALFSAVMQARCKMVFETLESAIQQDLGARKTLTLIGERFLSIIFEPNAINIYRVAIMEAWQFPELGKLFYESGPMRSTALLADYFTTLHKKGELRIPSPDLAASIFLGMLKNNIQVKCMLGLRKSVPIRERSELVRYVVDVFIAGHAPIVKN